VYVVALARVLGPDLYGLFAYGQSWYMAFLPLTAFGLAGILSREIGRDRKAGSTIVANTISIRILTSAIGAFACGAMGWFIESDVMMRQLLLIFSLALAGRAGASWAEQVFVAYESSHLVLAQEALFRPLEVVVGLTVLIFDGGVIGIVLLHAIVWWLQAIRGIWLVHRRLVRLRLGKSWKELSQMLRRGAPICTGAVLGSWLMQGPLVLYRYTDTTDTNLGQLAVAMQALAILAIIPWSIGSSALPILSRAADRGDGKDQLFVEGMTRLGFLFAATAGLIGMTLGPWLIGLVFGAKYTLAGTLLGPVLWLLAPLTVATSASQVILARGLYKTSAICAFIGATGLTASLPSLTTAFGPLGPIIATGIGMTLWATALLVAVNTSGGLSWELTIARPFLVVVAASGGYLLFVNAIPWFALLVSLLLLALGAWYVILAANERAMLLALLRRQVKN